MKVNTIVLAGGRPEALGIEDLEAKSLIEVNGQALVSYVLRGLRQAQTIGKIVVVAPFDAAGYQWSTYADDCIAAGNDLMANVSRGMSALGAHGLVLVCSSDIPLINGAAVDDFVERCRDSQGEFCYPIISKEVMIAAFPETKRTYAVLKDGVFTGGNLGLVSGEVFAANYDLFAQAYASRKSPARLFRMLGLPFILKLLLRSLTIREAERRCSKLLNADAKAIMTPYAQIGIDVDKKEDLELVKGVL